MTISNNLPKAGPFTCNGATTDFPFSFKCFAIGDVRVVLTNSSDVESDLTIVSHYTVVLNGDQNASPGGTVTTLTAYATGNEITLVSDVDFLQSLDLTNGGAFSAEAVESAFDKLTIQVQQNKEELDRAVKVNISSAQSPDGILDDIIADVATASASAASASASASAASGSAAAALSSANDASASEVAAEAALASILGLLVGSSTTSLAIGSGSKAFTTQDDRAFEVGAFVIAFSASQPTNYMIGQSTAYTGTSFTMTVGANDFNGSGTYTDWVLAVSGARGSKGDTGPAGAGSGDMLKTENLSGLANNTTARSNLGCATLAGNSSQAFAVLDDAYAAGWNGSSNVPTKNAVYDKVETLAAKGTNGDITSLTALTNITASAVTVATDDKVLIRDTSDSNNIKTVTAQSIADLAAGSGGLTLLKYTVITATNASWAKQAGTTAIEVLCVGGGGAGGGCTTTADGFGDGGQAGEQVRGYLDTGLTSTFVATIGAGGTGVSAAGGNDGNTTSFTTSTPTTIASAFGGYGGEFLGVATSNAGAINGHSGVKRGGKNSLGLAGSAAAANSGAGGGGAASTGSNLAGGAGGSGVIYVWEYG